MRRSRLLFLILTIVVLVFLTNYNLYFSGRIFPNIFVAGINVGGLKPEEAVKTLSQNTKVPEKINLSDQTQPFTLKTKEINLSYDFVASVKRSFDYTRTGNPVYDFVVRLKLLKSPVNLGLITNLDENKLSKVISVVSGQNSIEPTFPSIKIVDGKINVNKGLAGSEVDQILLRTKIGEQLSFTQDNDIEVPVNIVDPSLTDLGTFLLKSRAEKYLDKNLHIKFEYSGFNLTPSRLVKFINPGAGFNDQEITKEISIIESKINRNPQNPKFSFENGKVSEFLPALDGIKLENDKLKEKITESLNKIEDKNNKEKTIVIDAPVIKTLPEITTDKANDFGIKEVIGRGTSTYFHSIPGRIHNISLATSRINGILVKPGETFSFNEALGDVSAFTGYQQAYIISEGKTILGDGGGVCQVSSTLFRALLGAGLPIAERSAHAYRVGYYEQGSPPGMDATVYSPSPDLKFTNDTGNYILIEAKADPKKLSLVFELYGTKDGRIATTTKPIISNATPPLETVYQDDPTLPVGTLKQVDYSASGAKVVFDYTVSRDGQEIYKKTFVSNYRPWAAVYLRGTMVK